MKYNGEKKCPKCHRAMYGYPAISRSDNKTEICSSCGFREAIEIYYNYLSQKK